MTAPRQFGTDGIRGVANAGALAPERLLGLGRAIGRLARRRGGGVALARDPRRSSPLVCGALLAGASSEGAAVQDLGVLPTPGLAILLADLGAALGVMVSASHNPMPDNGVKVLCADGGKLDEADEAWLEAEQDVAPAAPPPAGAAVGAVAVIGDAGARYAARLRAAFPRLDLAGLRLVVDAANGAASAVAPALLEELGADVVAIHAAPDGLNINADCGAVHPQDMARRTREAGADLGLALDGDGDRAIFAGRDGALLDGDRVLYVCARHLLERGRLAGDSVVGTVMSNFGLELALRDLGVSLERTPVGDKHVGRRLREGGLALGGEPSGHVIFGADHGYVGDGLYTALRVLEVMAESGRSFEELAAPLAPVPQRLLNVRVRSKPALESLPDLHEAIRAAEEELAAEGRLVVRYSGTEDLLRVMVEGRDAATVERLAESLSGVVRKLLGVEAPAS